MKHLAAWAAWLEAPTVTYRPALMCMAPAGLAVRLGILAARLGPARPGTSPYNGARPPAAVCPVRRLPICACVQRSTRLRWHAPMAADRCGSGQGAGTSQPLSPAPPPTAEYAGPHPAAAAAAPSASGSTTLTRSLGGRARRGLRPNTFYLCSGKQQVPPLPWTFTIGNQVPPLPWTFTIA